MKVKTSNPVMIGNKVVNGNDEFFNAEGVEYVENPEDTYTEGDFKIQTSYPVIVDDKALSPKEYYLNVNGTDAKKTAPSMDKQVDAKKKGMFWDKVKGGWQKISNSPAAQFALQQVGAYMAQNSGAPVQSAPVQSMPTPATDEPTTMSKGVKIALIVGGVAVAGLIIYSIIGKGSKSSK